MKKFNLFKLLALFVVLITSINTAWAFNETYIVGDLLHNYGDNKWTSTDYPIGTYNVTGTGSNYMYVANGNYFQMRINGKKAGQNNNWDMTTDGTSSTFYRWTEGEASGAAHYTGYSGIVKFNCTSTVSDNPVINLTRPDVYIRHNWSNLEWSNKKMTDNEDGTYTLVDYYSGTKRAHVGPDASSKTDPDAIFKDFDADGDNEIHLIGSPTTGDKCLFTFNSYWYRAAGQSSTGYVGALSVAKIHTVTFNMKGVGGDNFTNDVVCVSTNDQTVSQPDDPSQAGYTFGGWYTDEGCTVAYNFNTTVTSSFTLYAKWTPVTYSVTINSNNSSMGTLSIDDSSESWGAHTIGITNKITVTPNAGYYFTGWSDMPSGMHKVSDATTVDGGNAYFYADGTGKTITANFAERYILLGSSKDNDANLYGLAGWSATSNSSYASNSISDGVLTITANLTKAKTNYKCLIQDLKDNARKGQTGTGYIGDNESWTLNGTNDVYFTSTAVGTYTFTYNLSSGSFKVVHPAHYSITYSYDTGGSSVTATVGGETIGSSPGYAVSGANVVMTATAAPGYTFVKWVDGSGNEVSTSNPYTISSINADKILVAKFTPNTHTLRFNLNGGNNYSSYGNASESAGVVTMNVTYGQVLNDLILPYAIKNAYHFETWSTSDTYMYSGDVWKYYYSVVPRVHGWDEETNYVTKEGDNYVWRNTSANGTTIDLYAHYGEPNTPRISFSPDHAVPEGEVTATILYSEIMGQPEGVYTLCYKLTTAGGTILKVQPELSQNDAARTVTFTAPASPGEYSLGVKLYPGTGATWETAAPIAPFDGNCVDIHAFDKFEVEAMNAVTVSYMSGTAEMRPSITAYATYSNPATLTAPEIPGMEFDRWTFTGSAYLKTGYEETDKTVEVRATGTGTATATYNQGSLFFKDTKSWGAENIYVYFYNANDYWTTSKGNSEGTGSDKENSKFISGPHLMTLLEGTDDVYYYSEGLPEGTVSVAFANKSMEDYEYFAQDGTPCEAVRVKTLNPNKPMIVPVGNGAVWNQGKCKYYAHDEAPILMDWGYNLRGVFNSWSASKNEFKSAKLGDLSFTTTVYLDEANQTYQWKIYNGNKGYGLSGDPTLTKTNPTSNTLENHDASGWNLQVKTNIAGEYTFTLNYGLGTSTSNTNGETVENALLSNMKVTVTYPVVQGDYRLIYTGGTNPHPGNVIKKRANGEDIVSMYVASDKADKIKIQACTETDNTSVTWGSATNPTYGTDVYSAFTTLLSKEGSGVYNFYITQDASGNPKITNVEKYTGRFYVRTNCVNDDKWNYKDSKDAHAMTYSEWSEKKMDDTDMRFSHYYVDDLHGTSGSPINIRFTVATDYSDAICDTVFEGDADGKWKDYIHSESLQRTANVRFTYDQNRNKIWRAYTEGPENNDYMVLRSNGTDVFVVNGLGGQGAASDAVKFTDLNNWVYQADVFANVNTYIKLTADIAEERQYLRGNNSDSDFDKDDAEMLIGGSGSGLSAQHMRITYDFKTDRMTTSWIPSTAVSGTLDIHADIMLLRTHQEGATSITFNSGGKLTDVKTAYGVMEFQKDYINDYSLSRYERNLYWISFPFDVNLSDVFGFGKYGEHWIIEYYDGKGRAEKGYWAESEPNWKFVTEEVKNEFVLKANEGYILALALSNMTEYSNIWANSVTSVYLYFPSANTIGNLSNVSSVTVEMDTVGYKCKITRDNRHIKDSYWRCIGVPSYALSTRTGLPTSAPDNWETKVPYVYIWNSINNSLAITSNAEVNFEAMHSYLIQYPDDKMVWTNVTNVPTGVMRRRVEGNNASFYEWNLNLLNNGQHIDHTYVRLSNDENVTDGYDFGNDLSKEFNSGSNIYTFVDDVEVAGNVKPIRTETTIVPVGVKIAADGEYTFAMPEGTNGVSAVLIDNIAGTRTNLALDEYTVSLESGTINGRFFLEISPIANTPTDVDNVQSDNVQGTVRKVMVDGIMYIVKDGKVFDAQGNRVR